ncbi:hypothetical protein D9758_012008 [Tetrapyrgos nigripes]|uniref:ribonuclease H n=1 Tax=Tetrapyrgos nigripes TaxID=182062 RepID=A0A8H5CR55_9AGAR|nr:hypothetical protein D9758_012008 [Tetrapyrgos nigripes]
MLRAKQLLNTLPQKWGPQCELAEDCETSLESLESTWNDGWEPFDRTVTTDGDLSDVFRIFTNKESKNLHTIYIPSHVTTLDSADQTITIAMDGSCTKNREDDARAGAGIFIDQGHTLNRSIKLPLYILQSNQTGELVAVKVAAETTPPQLQLNIEMDSKYVLNLLTRDMRQHEDEGYTTTVNRALVQSTIASFCARTTLTCLKWVKGHAGNIRNEGADDMAQSVLDKSRPSYINTNPPPALQVHGAKLKAMTQALANQVILQQKVKEGNMD